jgi:DNA-binding transcriptional LysR family regulator
MDLRQLRSFVTVADERQFTRAADRLLIAQPAVSTQIRRLERELGEPLFHRDRRETTLTAAGEALLPHARAALAAADRGRETIASLRGVLHGRLHVGVAGPVDDRLGRALAEFRRAHPAVEVRLSSHPNADLIDGLARGEIDAGIVGLGAQPLPPTVSTLLLYAEPLVLATAPDDPLAQHTQTTITALRDQPVITLLPGSGLRTVLEQACEAAGFSPQVVAEAAELTSLVRLVAAGLGRALAPRSATTGHPIATLDLTRPRLERRTALAWNPTGQSPAGRAFVALARTATVLNPAGVAQSVRAAES